MKFSVYAQTVASKYLGEIEADSLEEALAKANEDADLCEGLYMPLCHQCAGGIDLGDPDFVIEPAE